MGSRYFNFHFIVCYIPWEQALVFENVIHIQGTGRSAAPLAAANTQPGRILSTHKKNKTPVEWLNQPVVVAVAGASFEPW